jgi:hypothetical protein
VPNAAGIEFRNETAFSHQWDAIAVEAARTLLCDDGVGQLQ